MKDPKALVPLVQRRVRSTSHHDFDVEVMQGYLGRLYIVYRTRYADAETNMAE